MYLASIMFLPAKKTINQQPSFRNAGEIVKEQSSLLGMVKIESIRWYKCSE